MNRRSFLRASGAMAAGLPFVARPVVLCARDSDHTGRRAFAARQAVMFANVFIKELR
jgi:hypothetical protein